jgi:hypothetical protein
MKMKWSSNRAGFRRHNTEMREFCKSHAPAAMANRPRYGELAIMAKIRPLQLRDVVTRVHEALPAADVMDRSVFTPVIRVAEYKLSRN